MTSEILFSLGTFAGARFAERSTVYLSLYFIADRQEIKGRQSSLPVYRVLFLACDGSRRGDPNVIGSSLFPNFHCACALRASVSSTRSQRMRLKAAPCKYICACAFCFRFHFDSFIIIIMDARSVVMAICVAVCQVIILRLEYENV